MVSKLLFLLVISGINSVLGQSASCVYTGSGSTYQCALSINNPNGFDNFTSIGGTHLAGRTDADVTRLVQSNNWNSTIFPAIICEQFPNLIGVYVERTNLQTITERSFAGCTIVTDIQLLNNRLNTPPVNLLVNNPLVKTFRLLGNNMIDALPEGLFDPIPNMIWFCHENNPTGKLLPQIFRGLAVLDELHIYSMNLNEFSNCLLWPLVNIRLLYVSGNKLKVLHQKSFPPTKNRLQTFDFGNNKLEAIDRRIFDDTPLLSSVSLNNNVCINQSFSNFNSNRTYYLSLLEPCFAEYDLRFPTDDSGSTCNFIEHPTYGYTCELINFDPSKPIINNHAGCVSDSDVTAVIFTSTKIQKIPQEIFPTFPNLKFIEAIDSGLETASIENCGRNLKFIDVSRNSIRSLPSDSFACENLETIIADNNCIGGIEPCEMTFIERLKKLKKVSLRGGGCVDEEFHLEEMEIEEVEKKMRRCFKMWYMM